MALDVLSLKQTALGRAATRLSMVLFLLLWVHQSGKPLHLDDVDHYGIAAAIVETGRPVYYRGEDAPALSGALHPPLNDFLLAGWFVVFGTGVLQARSFAAEPLLVRWGLRRTAVAADEEPPSVPERHAIRGRAREQMKIHHASERPRHTPCTPVHQSPRLASAFCGLRPRHTHRKFVNMLRNTEHAVPAVEAIR